MKTVEYCTVFLYTPSYTERDLRMRFGILENWSFGGVISH
jgi:hypothetical protein